MAARFAVLAAVATIIAVVGAGLFLALSGAPPAEARPAPAFTVFTVDGETMNTNSSEVMLLDFSGTLCAPCRLVEVAVREVYGVYSDRVTFLSAFIGGGYGSNDNASIISFRDYEESQGRPVPWELATAAAYMQGDYGVPTIPHVFILRDGYVTFDWTPTPTIGSTPTDQARSAVGPALERAVSGTATPISVTSLSIPALLIIAAFLSFFSPCSFPVLPAFMSYYLNLDAKGESTGPKASTKTAAGRGFVASLGIVTVYGMIALVVFAVGFAAQAVVKWLPPVIGVVLITLAVLSLLPYQYHFLTRPFIALKQKLVARFGGRWQPGVGTKLYAFGMGYGAAGFACVAPPFIGAVLNASALGSPEQAVIGLLLYVVIVISLMIGIVVALHLAGDRALKKVRTWSGIMKYVSAVALIIAGSYLLYLFAIENLGR